MNNSEIIVWHKGEYLPESKALIPAISASVGYGEGVFDTLCIKQNKIFEPEKHLERFNKAVVLLWDIDDFLILDTFLSIIRKLTQLNAWFDGNARIRLQVGNLNPTGNFSSKPDLFLTIKMSPINFERKNATLTFSEIIQKPVHSLPGSFKWSQYLANIYSLKLAKQKGFDDAIFLTDKGYVCETSIANIFWIKDSIIYTPDDSTGILPGIMREAVVEIIKTSSAELKTGCYSKSELLKADAVFLTNSVKSIQMVDNIDGYDYSASNDIAIRLIEELRKYIEKNSLVL